MRLRLIPEARLELRQATSWYEDRQEGLGDSTRAFAKHLRQLGDSRRAFRLSLSAGCVVKFVSTFSIDFLIP
jgi:hypothetical protein